MPAPRIVSLRKSKTRHRQLNSWMQGSTGENFNRRQKHHALSITV